MPGFMAVAPLALAALYHLNTQLQKSVRSLDTLIKHFTFMTSTKTNERMAGISFLKLAIALHQYIENPSWTPNIMAHERDALFHESRTQKRFKAARLETGREFLNQGMEAAFQKAAYYFPILGVHGTWQGLRAKYEQGATITNPGQITWGPHPLEQLFGRAFRTKDLASLALRHHSVKSDKNNERLEYVGDAVWDVVADLFWIRHCLVPCQAGRSKMNTVSNKALSTMAVELGISELLEVHLSMVDCVDEAASELKVVADRGNGFCRPEKIPTMKAFADEFEAVIGALFIDAGLDLAPVEAFFERRIMPMLTKQLPQYAFQ